MIEPYTDEFPQSTQECSRCGVTRDAARFYRNGKFYKSCNSCSEGERLRYRRNTEYVFGYLCAHPCEVCGEDDPVVLEFHHTDPSRKSDTISNMIKRNSIEKIASEMIKCRVLCANCHRRITAAENDWYITNLDPGEFRDIDFPPYGAGNEDDELWL